jgi:hypothetical protein
VAGSAAELSKSMTRLWERDRDRWSLIAVRGWVLGDGVEHPKEFDWKDYYCRIGDQMIYGDDVLVMGTDGWWRPVGEVTDHAE